MYTVSHFFNCIIIDYLLQNNICPYFLIFLKFDFNILHVYINQNMVLRNRNLPCEIIISCPVFCKMILVCFNRGGAFLVWQKQHWGAKMLQGPLYLYLLFGETTTSSIGDLLHYHYCSDIQLITGLIFNCFTFTNTGVWTFPLLYQ